MHRYQAANLDVNIEFNHVLLEVGRERALEAVLRGRPKIRVLQQLV